MCTDALPPCACACTGSCVRALCIFNASTLMNTVLTSSTHAMPFADNVHSVALMAHPSDMCTCVRVCVVLVPSHHRVWQAYISNGVQGGACRREGVQTTRKCSYRIFVYSLCGSAVDDIYRRAFCAENYLCSVVACMTAR